MATQHTNAETLTQNPFQGTILRTGKTADTRTDVDSRSRRPNILIVAPSNSTEELPKATDVKSLKITSAKAPTQTELQANDKSIQGVVCSYDEISVQCTMRIEATEATIVLPRSLFPGHIRYGLPISLEMIEHNGIRRPSISLREIEPQSTGDIAREFDEIINSL
jgi:hypothetical protein